MKYVPWLLAAALFAFPLGVSAAVFMSDEQVLSLKEPVDDDLFAVGETVLIDQPITGDLFAAGERVTVGTTVSEDTFAAGSIVEINGTIADDLFIAANTATIAATTDDLFATGSEITFDNSSTVTGDAYVAGQTVALAGTFAGDVRVTGQTIVVAEGTTINGDLLSHGKQPLIESGVTIKGMTRHTPVRPKATQAGMGSVLVSTGMWFVMALLVQYLLPGFTTAVLTQPPQALKTFALGLAWLILLLPAAVMLVISVIGIPVSIMLLLLTGLLVLLAIAYTTLFIGRWAQARVMKRDAALSWHYMLVGAVLYSLLAYIPLVGTMLGFTVTVWMFGMLVRAVWSHRGVSTL